jgi:glycerophosphoryl diester phosphodiesterase
VSGRPLAAVVSALLLASLAACSPARPVSTTTAGRTLAQLEAPVIIAHRGGGDSLPENTLYGMDRVARYPSLVLDADVRLTRDGTLVLNHDATLDRLSAPLRGPIDGYTEETWKSVPVRWPAGSTVQPQPPVHASTWRELADKWGGKRVLSVEGKTPAASAALVRDVLERRIQTRVLFKSSSVEDCRRAAAAGIAAAVIFRREPDLDAVAEAGGWGVVLYDRYATAKTIDAAHGRGLEVIVLRVDTPREMRTFLARGALGFATEKPFALSGFPVPSENSP